MRPTALACEDIETEPVTWNVETEQERLMRQILGNKLYETLDTMERDAMEFNTIHRVAPYETQLDQYVWREREKWAWYGTVAGSIITSVFWLLVLGF